MGRSSTSDLVRSYLSSFASGDPANVAAHVSDDFVNEHLGALAQGCVSKAVYAERLKGFLAGFEGLSYEILSVVADDEKGAARYIMRFRQKEREIEVRGVMWFEFAGDLISKRIDCWDGLKYLQQVDASAEDIAKLVRP
ncbi:MAG: nuclear transport factor 2 family protein [Pseudomonadota bacterium]